MPNSSTSNPSPSNPTPSSAPLVVEQAALITTFYGPRLHMGIKKVREKLIEKLNLTPYGNRGEDWVNLSQPDEPILLRRFDPPAAHDTRVVQLALNHGGQVKEGWQAMRQQLERILHDDDLREIWGYTLIYQAVIEGNTVPDAENAALRELLAYAQRMYVPSVAKVPILAQSDVEGGRLWLTKVPLEEDGAAAAILYVALVPTDKQDDLIEKGLYGRVIKTSSYWSILPFLNPAIFIPPRSSRDH